MPSPRPLRVAILALVRHLIARDVHVTLVTKPPFVPTPTPPRKRGGAEGLVGAGAPAARVPNAAALDFAREVHD
jgi:hypothetical protein